MPARRIHLATGVALLLAACTNSSDAGSTDVSDTTGTTVTDTIGTTASDTIGAGTAVVERAEWGDAFAAAGVVGTFALREVGDEQTQVWDVERAATELLPASTFKILNSMIILETATLPDVDTLVPWDGVERAIDVWNRDHSLRTGIEVSAVWMYQALAREVGDARMSDLVERAGYGNGDIGGGIDQFWLSGDLRISALGQLDFLEAMVEGRLPFRPEVVEQVRAILVRESGPDWTWSHKTGTALAAEPDLGWLVGTSEHGGRTWVFALNVDLDSVDELATEIDPLLRQTIARELLVAAGALPA